MKTTTTPALTRGRLPLAAFLPVIILALLALAALFLPATDLFDTVRGVFVGMLAVAAVATVVAVTTTRRRARQLAERRALDDLEPLRPSGSTSPFNPSGSSGLSSQSGSADR